VGSKILERIIEELPEGAPIRDVSIFLHATAVTSRTLGLAYSFPRRSTDLARDRGEMVAGSGRLTSFAAKDLARYALSSRPAEASVGVAAINSLLEPPAGKLVEKSGVDIVMEHAAGRRLAVIGHFPFVERVKPLVKSLWVLELDPQEGDLPASDAPTILPHADVVAITGTTFINHTIDGLLDLAKGKRIIILGPSTILSPVLFEAGVAALCGICVEDQEVVLRHLREGAGFRRLPGLRYVTLLP
jgi:uncharacterized protein